ncbi:MAG: glycosyltransferase family 4 protein, partial [Endomicrobiia bacterium]
MQKKVKILYFDMPLDPPGGGQISLFYLLINLNRTKFDLRVILPYSCEFEKWLKTENINVKITNNYFAEIKNFHPDIVHCNSATTKHSFLLAVLSKILNVPFVWHNRVLDTAGWKEKLIALLSTKIIVISDEVGNKFSWTKKRNKIVKIYNAIDFKRFISLVQPELLRAEFGIKLEQKIVGIFSRLVSRKGHKLFFDAAKMIVESRRENLDVVFLVVGDGDKRYKEELLDYVNKLGIKEKVIFTGFRKDVSRLMNLCDVIVNPSVEPEAFGRTIVEGMACGKVVIATDIGGPKEIITDGVDGYLIAPVAKELCEKTINILLNKNLYTKISNNATNTVKNKFSVEKQTDLVENL